MIIRVGEWNFEVEEISNHKVTFSRLTAEKLHSFETKLKVDNDEADDFEQAFDEYKHGEIFISDELLNLHNCKFCAKINSSSKCSTTTYTRYSIAFEECSNKKITGIELEQQRLEAYEISQHVDKNAIVIEGNFIVNQEQFEMINRLRYGDADYFPVVRLGIDDAPLQMRFGRNLWSANQDIIKMSLVLVEEEYDQKKDKFHGFSEPELSIAITQIKQLKAMNARLLDVLVDNKLITEKQRTDIEKELTSVELRRENYLYDRVKDVDEWR